MPSIVGSIVTDVRLLRELEIPEGLELRVELTQFPHTYYLYSGRDLLCRTTGLDRKALKYALKAVLPEKRSARGNGPIVSPEEKVILDGEDVAANDTEAESLAGTGDDCCGNPELCERDCENKQDAAEVVPAPAVSEHSSYWQTVDTDDAIKSIQRSRNQERLSSALNDSRDEVREAAKTRLERIQS